MNKSYFCQNCFLMDWCHKHLKNTVDIMLFYGGYFYGFLEYDLWKRRKKTFISQQYIYIYILGHRHFKVLWIFILYILHRFVLSLKNSHYGYIPLYIHKTLPTLGNEKEQ